MLLAFLAVAAATQPHPGKPKVFGDWIIACDNGRVCGAVALTPSGDPNDASYASLEIERKAEGTAPPTLLVVQSPDGVVALRAGGRRISLPVDKTDTAAVRPADVPAVIEALRTDPVLELLDGGDKVVGRISAKGVGGPALYG